MPKEVKVIKVTTKAMDFKHYEKERRGGGGGRSRRKKAISQAP